MSDVTNLLWVEKYRPKTLSDCILPIDLTTVLKGMVKEKKIPNMMFYGTAGTGGKHAQADHQWFRLFVATSLSG